MSFVIGVYGTIGSGKSTVARIIREKYGYAYIDCDFIGHMLLEEENIKQNLIQLFGNQILSNESKILRKNISRIIFTDQALKRKYEQFIWPKMTDNLTSLIKGKSEVVLEAAVLFSAGWNIFCQETIYIEAPLMKIERYLKNRNIAKSDLQFILNSQQDIKKQKNLASIQIMNDGSYVELVQKVLETMQLVQKRRMEKEQPD
jgi:dephospho-CoA kinase